MPESGEWFSPRTRPEMLSSDDPPERTEKPAQILPGPGSLARRTLRPAYRAAVSLGRTVPALGRAASVLPAVGRRLGIDHPNSRQRAGIWATGAAVVTATGLAVAAAVVGAPAVVSQQFDRLSVLPGLGDAAQDAEGSGVPVDDVTGQPETRADGRVAGPADARSGSSSTGSVTSYGYSLPGVPAGAPLPAGVTGTTGGTTGPTAGGPGVPAVPAPVRTTRPAPGVTTAPGGGTTTAPPPVDPTVDPTVPPVDPTTDPPVEPTTPPVEPTTPPPPEDTTPPDSPPTVDPPADDPPADEPVVDPPADDPPVEGDTPSPDAQPPAATPTP